MTSSSNLAPMCPLPKNSENAWLFFLIHFMCSLCGYDGLANWSTEYYKPLIPFPPEHNFIAQWHLSVCTFLYHLALDKFEVNLLNLLGKSQWWESCIWFLSGRGDGRCWGVEISGLGEARNQHEIQKVKRTMLQYWCSLPIEYYEVKI